MQLTELEQIFDLLKGRPRQHLAAAWAIDAHTIEAVSRAVDMDFLEATLVGDEKTIEQVCENHGIDSGKFNIVHEPTDISAVVGATDLINSQKCNLLMKGSLSTDKYIRAILNKDRGLMDHGSVLSHVTVMRIASYHKLLIIGDVAIIPLPDLKQKLAIATFCLRSGRGMIATSPIIRILW